MTLLDLKQFMMKVKVASMGTLCRSFNKDPETLRCLLSHWIKKGKIKRCELLGQKACGSSLAGGCQSRCGGCPMANVNLIANPHESYEWIDCPGGSRLPN